MVATVGVDPSRESRHPPPARPTRSIRHQTSTVTLATASSAAKVVPRASSRLQQRSASSVSTSSQQPSASQDSSSTTIAPAAPHRRPPSARIRLQRQESAARTATATASSRQAQTGSPTQAPTAAVASRLSRERHTSQAPPRTTRAVGSSKPPVSGRNTVRSASRSTRQTSGSSVRSASNTSSSAAAPRGRAPSSRISARLTKGRTGSGPLEQSTETEINSFSKVTDTAAPSLVSHQYHEPQTPVPQLGKFQQSSSEENPGAGLGTVTKGLLPTIHSNSDQGSGIFTPQQDTKLAVEAPDAVVTPPIDNSRFIQQVLRADESKSKAKGSAPSRRRRRGDGDSLGAVQDLAGLEQMMQISLDDIDDSLVVDHPEPPFKANGKLFQTATVQRLSGRDQFKDVAQIKSEFTPLNKSTIQNKKIRNKIPVPFSLPGQSVPSDFRAGSSFGKPEDSFDIIDSAGEDRMPRPLSMFPIASDDLDDDADFLIPGRAKIRPMKGLRSAKTRGSLVDEDDLLDDQVLLSQAHSFYQPAAPSDTQTYSRQGVQLGTWDWGAEREAYMKIINHFTDPSGYGLDQRAIRESDEEGLSEFNSALFASMRAKVLSLKDDEWLFGES